MPRKIDEVEGQYKKGIITEGERYNKIIDIWTGTTDDIAKAVFEELKNNGGKDTDQSSLPHDGFRCSW